ncbi:MAG: peptidoglycan DD-metalloendopeptidase family protein [Methylococcales bacterium]|nr:peptidoglycan DD-metalloendopeptidase family protein [Methylococcales bacterium]
MHFFLIVAFFIISGHLPLSANEKIEKLNELQTDIKDVNQTIEQISVKRTHLSNKLGQIEKQYGKTTNLLKSLTQKIDGKRRRLKEINKEISIRQKKLDIENHELNGQLKATHIMGKREKLKLLLNQQDPALASRMMMYYHYLNKARLTKLITLKKHIAVLEQLGQERKQEKKQLQKTSSVKKNQQNKLIKTKRQRQHLLSLLDEDMSLKSQQLTQLKGNEKQLRDLIVSLGRGGEPVMSQHDAETLLVKTDKPKKIKAKQKMLAYTQSGLSFRKLKGKLPWPLKGKVVKKFGSRRDDGRWDGFLISAKEGASIHAITDGQVIYADWLRGYGLLVIIDHGSGYMSLYAFNQSLNKKVGDKVKTGMVIASVGKSGGRSQAGLYFGVRFQGKSINPARWCQKIRSGYVG